MKISLSNNSLMIIMWEFYSVSVVPNMHSQYGSTGGGVFKRGGTKLERYSSMKKKIEKDSDNFWCRKLTLKVKILQFSTTFTQVYTRPKKKLIGSSLAFTLKEGPVRCAKVCNNSWVILIWLWVVSKTFFRTTKQTAQTYYL